MARQYVVPFSHNVEYVARCTCGRLWLGSNCATSETARRAATHHVAQHGHGMTTIRTQTKQYTGDINEC